MQRQQTPLGLNRTGIQMSPIDSQAMQEATEALQPSPTTEPSYVDVRAAYAAQAEPFGSVPVPSSLKGMLASGADMLTGTHPQVLIDKLGERLAFERGGTRLYESLLVKAGQSELLASDTLAELRRFHDEEAKHAALVVEALQSLGADPTAQTPCADLVGVESSGLIQAINDPRSTLLQCLHVILDAELVDQTGWEMLIELARACGHEALAKTFDVALQEEDHHLVRIRELVGRLTLQDAGVLNARGTNLDH